MHKLHYTNTSLLLIDWQERLFTAMPQHIRERNLRQTKTLKWLAEQKQMTIITSEQYPKGLGSTIESLEVKAAVPKLQFSAMRNPIFSSLVLQKVTQNVILTGMETHICVAQTCAELCQKGYDVWVPADAVVSRAKLDWKFGLKRMERMGARIVTTEAVLFELMQHSKDPIFKEISRMIR
jgi:nicotinamidase-related amidase